MMMRPTLFVLLVVVVINDSFAAHFESSRVRRETLVKHKTQHLKPPIEIDPIPNQRDRVPMPKLNISDLLAYADAAATIITTRFDAFEPALLGRNGMSMIKI